MQTFVIQYETSAGLSRSVEIQAHSVDGALAKWDLIRQPGDFVDAVGPKLRIQWPED